MIIRPSKLDCGNWTGDRPDKPFKRANSIVYEAIENGERVGCIRADAGGGNTSVHYVNVREQRRGVGTKLYEAAARGSCKRFGQPLTSSDELDLMTGSSGFWNKQLRKGRAHCILRDGNECLQFQLSCPAPKTLAGARRRRR